MSDVLRDRLGRLAKETALRACWKQWVGLGSPAAPTSSGPLRSIIEVEPLLVTSLSLAGEERHLEDLVSWWARTASSLTSVSRYRGLKRRFPPGAVEETLGSFAARAAFHGDKRWRSHAGAQLPEPSPRDLKGPDEADLTPACALNARLRAGLGVGAKADTLSFLLGLGGGGASVSRITFATGYTKVSVGRAAEDMARARLILQTNDRPAEYRAPPGPWRALLGGVRGSEAENESTAFPRWRYWAEVFAFLLGVIRWADQESFGSEDREFVSSSKARDLLERHQKAFALNQVPTPQPAAFPGREAPQGLMETTRAVSRWMEDAV